MLDGSVGRTAASKRFVGRETRARANIGHCKGKEGYGGSGKHVATAVFCTPDHGRSIEHTWAHEGPTLDDLYHTY